MVKLNDEECALEHVEVESKPVGRKFSCSQCIITGFSAVLGIFSFIYAWSTLLFFFDFTFIVTSTLVLLVCCNCMLAGGEFISFSTSTSGNDVSWCFILAACMRQIIYGILCVVLYVPITFFAILEKEPLHTFLMDIDGIIKFIYLVGSFILTHLAATGVYRYCFPDHEIIQSIIFQTQYFERIRVTHLLWLGLSLLFLVYG